MARMFSFGVLFGSLPFVVSCGQATANNNKNDKRNIPPIDAKAPVKIKTATFAVG